MKRMIIDKKMYLIDKNYLIDYNKKNLYIIKSEITGKDKANLANYNLKDYKVEYLIKDGEVISKRSALYVLDKINSLLVADLKDLENYKVTEQKSKYLEEKIVNTQNEIVELKKVFGKLVNLENEQIPNELYM